MTNGREKSDLAIVATKPANNDGQPSAELVERRAGAEGNAGWDCTRRAQDRESVSQGLDRVRHVARTRKKERFTALLHHVTPDLLRTSFFALGRRASAGHRGTGGQDRPTGHGSGAECGVRREFPRVLVRLPARAGRA